MGIPLAPARGERLDVCFRNRLFFGRGEQVNITKIEFYDPEIDCDRFGNANGNYSAKFTLVCDEAEYGGRATQDALGGVDVVWNDSEPDDEGLAAEIVEAAFEQSVSMAVVIDPVDLPTLLSELGVEPNQAAEGESDGKDTRKCREVQ